MYGEEYFRTDSPAYFNNFLTDADDLKTGKNPLLKILAQYTSLEGARLLDVGCASGALLAAAQAAGCHAPDLRSPPALRTKQQHTYRSRSLWAA